MKLRSRQRGYLGPAFFGGAAGGTGGLDPYTSNLWGAYGLSKFVGAYGGSAIRVRRSSDNAEQDIGFSGTALDTSALATFVGANSAYVKTFYDQSGLGHDFSQATSSKQPMIVDAGTYTGELLFDGSDDAMVTSASSGSGTSFTVFLAGHHRDPSLSGPIVWKDGATARWYVNPGPSTAGGNLDGFITNFNIGSSLVTHDKIPTDDNTVYGIKIELSNPSSDLAVKTKFYVNGTSQTALSVTGSAPAGLGTGAWGIGADVAGTSFNRIAIKTLAIYEDAKTDLVIQSISTLLRPVPATSRLDSYTSGLWGAYSLRKLLTSYAGSAIRVRRSSDNTEQDFGFSGGFLDTVSLLSFCGAGNGFVTKWYDQSGAGHDFVQTTTSAQPQIVSSGAVLSKLFGGPCINFDGTDDTFVSNTNCGAVSALTVFAKVDNERPGGGPTGMLIQTTTNPFGAGNNGFRIYALNPMEVGSTMNGTNYRFNVFSGFNAVAPLGVRVDRSLSTDSAQATLWSGGRLLTRTGTSNGGSVPSGNFTAAPWYLGSGAGTNCFQGPMETVLIYEASVSDANMERICRAIG